MTASHLHGLQGPQQTPVSKAYLFRQPWASEAIEAASHKVVAATALWQEGLRTNFYQRIMATEQSEKTEENKVV